MLFFNWNNWNWNGHWFYFFVIFFSTRTLRPYFFKIPRDSWKSRDKMFQFKRSQSLIFFRIFAVSLLLYL